MKKYAVYSFGRTEHSKFTLICYAIADTNAPVKDAKFDECYRAGILEVIFNVQQNNNNEAEIRQKALDYCAYLNSLEEAKEETIKMNSISNFIAKKLAGE